MQAEAERHHELYDDDDDPMQMIVCEADAEESPPKKASKKAPSPLKPRADQVVSVEVDLVPRAADPTSTAKKSVRVLIEGRQKLVRIHSEDLAWLVAYIADEVSFGGVVDGEPEVAG